MTGWDLLSEFSPLFARRGLTRELSSQLIRDCGLSPESILFIGSGTGAAVKPFADLQCNLLALDQSWKMAERCLATGIPSVVGNALDPPMRKGIFDLVVVVTGVLDCMDDQSSIKVLYECYRITRPNSTLVVTCFDHTQDMEFYRRWGLAAGDRVLTQRKIELWREYEHQPHNFESSSRMRALTSFFRGLQAAAWDKNLPFEQVLASLPKFQVIRSEAKMSAMLAQAGWFTLYASTNTQSGAYYVNASKSRHSENPIVNSGIQV